MYRLSTVLLQSFLLVSLFFVALNIQAQCDQFVSINPKSPIRVCLKNGPETVKLNGAFSQKPCGFEWSPNDGKISDTKVLSPTVTIDAPGTYTYKLSGAFAGTGPNLVVNGDFSQGNVNFGSEMNYTPGPSCPPGNYTITNQSPTNFNGAWSDCRNGGNLFLADSPSDPDVRMWYQTVNVAPNTWYLFEFDFTSVFFANPPKMVGMVNGVELGPTVDAPGATCVWITACFAWFSGSSTTAELAIKDKQAIQWGDDLAFDNIRFRAACSGMATVKIIAEEQPEIYRDTTKCYGSNIVVGGKVIADPGDYDLILPKGINAACDTILHLNVKDLEIIVDSVRVDTITCLTPKPAIEVVKIYAISGSKVDTLNFSYLWTTNNGQIESGSTSRKVIVSKAGKYNLKITYKFGKLLCTQNLSFDMKESIVLPNVNAGPDRQLDCDSTSITLLGSGPPNSIAKWTTKNGVINFGGNTFQPKVSKSGTYVLQVTNPINGCSNFDTVLVSSKVVVISLSLGKDTNLTCKDTVITLTATTNPAGSNYVYTWKTTNGNFANGSSGPTIAVDQVGTYFVTVIDLVSKCTASDTIQVGGSKIAPIASAGEDKELDCLITSVTLNGSASSQGNNFLYQWSSIPAGQPIVNGTATNPSISKKGSYIIAVTNTLNNCVAVDTVTVDLNANLPKIVIQTPVQLDCGTKSVLINGALGSNGVQYLYEWQTSNGSIQSGEYTNIVTVNAAGDYKFIVVDTSNGCKNDTTVKVIQDLTKPNVLINPAAQLNCTTPNIQLNAASSSNGPNFTFNWTTTNGSFLSGQNTLTPFVDNAGTYWLVVTNKLNNCSDSANVLVTQSSDLPKALIAPPSLLGCDKTSMVLDASGSSSGGNITLVWTTSNGSFSGPTNNYNPIINKGGNYQLVLTNTSSNCKDTAIVTVVEDKTKPIVVANVPTVLTCKNPLSVLDATGSATGANYVNAWYHKGNPIGDTLTKSVADAGTYTFIVKNSINQCVDSLAVQVNIDTIKPIADAGLNQNLVCVPDFVTINGSNSSATSKNVYLWTGPANAKIDDPDKLATKVYKSGNYMLTVKDTVNGCEASDQVVVLQNVTPPLVVLDKLPVINCSKPSTNLSGIGSTTGANISYNWTSVGGNIVGGGATLTPLVDKSGWYLLQVEDLLTKCKTIDSLELKADFVPPIANAGFTDTLTCFKTTLSLDANQSSVGSTFGYSWTTINGAVISGGNTLTPTVNKNGDYQLIVTNNNNGCKDTAFVKIEQDIKKPVALVNVQDTLNCRNAQVGLDGTPSILYGNAVNLTWKNVDNNTIIADNTLNITVNQKGLYRLIIENQKNRCVDSTLIVVFENYEKPVVNIAGKTILNCKDTAITLSATVQSAASSQYVWKKDGQTTTLNGLNPVITAPGAYRLVAMVTSSGCQDSSLILIDLDKALPTAAAGLDSTLTCYNPSLTLNGFASSSGIEFAYLWKELSGKPIASPLILNPLIVAPGTYVLEVTNSVNFCKSTDTLLIINNKIPPGITSIVADSINCIKSEAVITALSPTPVGNLVIDWSKTGGPVFGKDLNTLKPTVIQGGVYKLLLTNDQNGCKDSSLVKVEVDTAVQKIAITPASFLNCKVKEIGLKTTGITSSNYSYLWFSQDGKFKTPLNIANPTIIAGGQYVVTATNVRNGCISQAGILVLTDTIAPQAIILTPPIVDCNRPKIDLDASASAPKTAEFLWSTANGSIQSVKNLNVVTVDKGGVYDLLVTDPVNGCVTLTSIKVEEDKQKPLVSAGPDQELNCKTNDAVLDGSLTNSGADFIYKWTSSNGKIKADANQRIALAGSVGVYSLLVTNVRNGCTQSDEMAVTANRPDKVVINVKIPNCDSEIGTIQILGASGGKPPYFYTLKDWQAFSKKIPDSENVPIGKYTVRIKDANDCEFKTTAEVKVPAKPKATLSPANPQIFEKDSVRLYLTVDSKNPLSEILWTSKDTTYKLLDNFNVLAAPLQSSLYKVYVKDINGCKDSVQNWVYVKELSEVFIPNAFTPNGDGANDFFTVFANDRTAVKIVKFEVFNRWGELVFANRDFNPNVESEGWDGRFNGKILNPAVFVYVVQVEFLGGRTKTYKGDITLLSE